LDQEQPTVKQMLDRELADLRFDTQAHVIGRTHPTTWRGRLRAFWNKELELPMVPLGTAFVFFLTASFLYYADRQPKADPAIGNEAFQQRELIEAGGSVYWKDEIERRLSHHENPNQG
jgi:hypothetical protein